MKYYRLLIESKSGTFAEMIEAHINDGWELHGTTFFTDRRFAQAVTKVQRAPNKKPDPRKGLKKVDKTKETVVPAKLDDAI